jgi:hypothetical protein
VYSLCHPYSDDSRDLLLIGEALIKVLGIIHQHLCVFEFVQWLRISGLISSLHELLLTEGILRKGVKYRHMLAQNRPLDPYKEAIAL